MGRFRTILQSDNEQVIFTLSDGDFSAAVSSAIFHGCMLQASTSTEISYVLYMPKRSKNSSHEVARSFSIFFEFCTWVDEPLASSRNAHKWCNHCWEWINESWEFSRKKKIFQQPITTDNDHIHCNLHGKFLCSKSCIIKNQSAPSLLGMTESQRCILVSLVLFWHKVQLYSFIWKNHSSWVDPRCLSYDIT